MVITTLSALYVMILLFKAGAAFWVLRQVEPGAPSVGADEVTILQPILSGDDALPWVLADNLIALPDAHFIWLIDDNDTPARLMVEMLRAHHPHRRIHIMSFPPAPDGVNPKSFKLEGAWRQVETRVCLVLDDDARLPATSLAAMLAAAAPRTLVTALPYALDDEGGPSRLLAQFVNNNAALTYLVLLPFAAPLSINGMCYALRTEFLAQLGGFLPIQRHLTDDLALAWLARAHGGRLRQLCAPVAVQTSLSGAAHYCRQMHRWFLFATLLMRRQSVLMNLTILLLQCLHPLLLWGLVFLGLRDILALSSGQAGSGIGAATFLCVLLLRAVVLSSLQTRLTGALRHRPLLSLLSELLQPLHLLHAALYRKIRWRTRRYRVRDNDRFSAL